MAKRYRAATYHHKGKAAAPDYLRLAKRYAKEARADDAFNAKRKREGKPVVPAIRDSARKNRARARRYLEMARKAKAGYVGKYKAR